MAICKCWCGRQTGLSIIDGDWYCPDHCQPSPSSAAGGEKPGTVGEWKGNCEVCVGQCSKCHCVLAMVGWMPIKTVPKDVTPVLLTDGAQIMIGYVTRSGGVWIDVYGDDLIPAQTKITHWQPLPPAPQVKS